MSEKTPVSSVTADSKEDTRIPEIPIRDLSEQIVWLRRALSIISRVLVEERDDVSHLMDQLDNVAKALVSRFEADTENHMSVVESISVLQDKIQSLKAEIEKVESDQNYSLETRRTERDADSISRNQLSGDINRILQIIGSPDFTKNPDIGIIRSNLSELSIRVSSFIEQFGTRDYQVSIRDDGFRKQLDDTLRKLVVNDDRMADVIKRTEFLETRKWKDVQTAIETGSSIVTALRWFPPLGLKIIVIAVLVSQVVVGTFCVLLLTHVVKQFGYSHLWNLFREFLKFIGVPL